MEPFKPSAARVILFVCFSGLLWCAFASNVFAAAATPPCLPGIPCTEKKTENPTPLNPNPPPDPPPDGPNSTDGKNHEKTDSNTCDADFMNQIYARAFLESSREVMINQTVIRKPDSVMEYSCFDQAARHTGQIGGLIFSAKRWTPSSVPNPNGSAITLNVNFTGHLTKSIQNLVLASFNSYKSSNFSQTFLGGTSSENGGSAACDYMNSIHFLAKCNNMALDDRFLTFKELITTDPRRVKGGTLCGVSPITQTLIDVAENEDYEYVNFDSAKSLLEELGSGNSCALYVPTGIEIEQKTFSFDLTGIVVEQSSKTIKDAVCINPGCYFDGTRCKR